MEWSPGSNDPGNMQKKNSSAPDGVQEYSNKEPPCPPAKRLVKIPFFSKQELKTDTPLSVELTIYGLTPSARGNLAVGRQRSRSRHCRHRTLRLPEPG